MSVSSEDISNDLGVAENNKNNNLFDDDDDSSDSNLPIIPNNAVNQEISQNKNIGANEIIEKEQDSEDDFGDQNMPGDTVYNLDISKQEESDQEDNVKQNREEFDGFKRGEHSEKVMNDIFGDSDEEEDFEGFNENEIEKEPVRPTEDSHNELGDGDDDDDVPDLNLGTLRQEGSSDIMQCFENVLEKQRMERRMNRPKKRTDVDFLNDLDDRIADLMNKMRLAAVEDEELYHMGQPGIKKMKLLPTVRDLLRRTNIKEVLIESKFLSIMAAWLKALPNQVLPPLDIRKTMLIALQDFPTLSPDVLRESKIGKAVMYLLQHPQETRENKRIAKMLINEWSRKVFNLSSNYKGMTREERLERDRAIASKRQLVDKDASSKKELQEDGERQATRPGEEGWIPRATVPKPSNKDYIIRPQWRFKECMKRKANGGEDDEYDEDDMGSEDEEDVMNRLRPSLQKKLRMGTKAQSNSSIFERTYRRIKDAGKAKRQIQRAEKISIQGRGMRV